MLTHPLDRFYAADLDVPQDHLPGDLRVLYALGHLWQWGGGGEFAGTGAAMIVLKLVAILLDLILGVIAAGIVPRLRPAAWVLAAGLLINMWFVWGFWHPAWLANISYPDWLYRAMASGNMIGFWLLLWHTWSRQRDVEITGAS